MVGPFNRSVFVGRQREMDELKAALEDALAGRGRLVMLAGEPGIGKTRTAEELAAIARQRGAEVLWSRCPEERGAPPYWPWVQMVRSHVGERDLEVLRAEMGAGASDIAEIVPEVRERLPDLLPSPRIDDLQQARFRLFDSITSFFKKAFFKKASEKQPLVLVLDNLHWADPSSLRLLEFVAQELASARLLVIGTYRDVDVSRRHPLFLTLGELTRQHLFQRVLLRGLSQEEVGKVIEVTGRVEPSQDLVRVVHRQTEGNPLFVREVVRFLAQEDVLGPEHMADLQSWDFRLPEGIREVIGRTLSRLSDPCNEVLAIASVIGREFSVSLLQRLAGGLSEDQLLEVLEEALVARAIEELPRSAGRYQFTHALVQQALAAELSINRQVRLHARIGQALEEMYGEAARSHAAELARHFAASETLVGADKLVHYSLLAGEQALTAYAYEEALEHFQRALAAKEGQPTDAETAALLYGLGHAQVAMNLVGEAVSSLRRAFDYYIKSGDVSRAVAIAEYPHSGDYIAAVRDLIYRALQIVPPDSHQAGRILSNHGYCLGLTSGGYEEAQAASDQVLAIARRERDPALEMRALASRGNIAGFHMRWEESLVHSLQAIELAALVDDPHARLRAHLWAGYSLLYGTGDAARARVHGAEMMATAERLRDRLWLPRALALNVSLSSLVGDWQAARDFSNRGLTRFPRNLWLLGLLALVEYQLGDFSQGETYLERLLEAIPTIRHAAPESPARFPDTAISITQIARITGIWERLDVAQADAQAALSSLYDYPVLVSAARCALALVATHLGDQALAREQYTALAAHRGTILWYCNLSADRALGLLAQTIGQLGQAMAHFEDALVFCRRAGYRPELAWTCHDYAKALLNPVGAGLKPAPTHVHQAKAISLLDEALTISRELGMRPLMEKVVALQEKVEAQPCRGDSRIAPTYPGGLTEREVEVLRLIAAGKRNPEIAEGLFISLNTVARHVSHILTKTGAANRAEAATYAARHGLLG